LTSEYDFLTEPVHADRPSFTISTDSSFTVRGRFSEVLVIGMKVEIADYEKAIGWMRDSITGLVFTKDR
jgi:Zn-dependent M16 (insulinase) family peptidase